MRTPPPLTLRIFLDYCIEGWSRVPENLFLSFFLSSVEQKISDRVVDSIKKPSTVPHNLVRRIRFWRIKYFAQDFRFLY